MTENKLKLIVKCVTVFAVMLLCAMLIGLTIQFVNLARLKKQKTSQPT